MGKIKVTLYNRYGEELVSYKEQDSFPPKKYTVKDYIYGAIELYTVEVENHRAEADEFIMNLYEELEGDASGINFKKVEMIPALVDTITYTICGSSDAFDCGIVDIEFEGLDDYLKS